MLIPPTANVLNRVLWLGEPSGSGGLPIGSGVVVHVGGVEYLMTAHHVVEDCNFNPLVRYSRRWRVLAVVLDRARDRCSDEVRRTEARVQVELEHARVPLGCILVAVRSIQRREQLPGSCWDQRLQRRNEGRWGYALGGEYRPDYGDQNVGTIFCLRAHGCEASRASARNSAANSVPTVALNHPSVASQRV